MLRKCGLGHARIEASARWSDSTDGCARIQKTRAFEASANELHKRPGGVDGHRFFIHAKPMVRLQPRREHRGRLLRDAGVSQFQAPRQRVHKVETSSPSKLITRLEFDLRARVGRLLGP
jgi:hypothetical protein